MGVDQHPQRELNSIDVNTIKPSKKIQVIISSVIIHFILMVLAAMVVVPLILPFLFAFKTPLEFAYHPWGLPTNFQWENFKIAWESVKIGQGMKNTFLVCLGAIVTTVPPAAMAGYIFSRYRTKVTNFLFYIVIVTAAV